MIQFLGHSDGKAIVPTEPVDLPAGPLRVTVTLVEDATVATQADWDQVMELVREIEAEDPDLPSDLASVHDHYAHGAPKRNQA